MRLFIFLTVLALLPACSGTKVKQVYKPSSTNTFTTECEDEEQSCFKSAREHCDGDFEIVKKDVKTLKDNGNDDERTINVLEFKCI